jgi:hypothetical protein
MVSLNSHLAQSLQPSKANLGVMVQQLRSGMTANAARAKRELESLKSHAYLVKFVV